MSNRTLIEINHDYCGNIERNPTEFVEALLSHLRSIKYPLAPEIFPGVKLLGVRHHSEPFAIKWGCYEGQQGRPK